MTALDVFYQICILLGGLAVMMFGMKVLGDGLEGLAGNNIRRLLGKATSNRFAGVAVGTGVTALIQSSSATTVMLVGFVNVGLMTLAQATSVIMGANIGTTITLQIISFSNVIKITEIASILAAAGLFATLFAKREKIKQIGNLLIAFGMLFLGLKLMSDSMLEFQDSPAFKSFFQTISNPFLLVLIGMAFTAVIQSSAAATALLASLVASGSMTAACAFYAILGTNIGTCVTAILASIGTNENAKRTAFIHLMFNVIGCVLAFIVIYFLEPYVGDFFKLISGSDSTRQLANFHTIFNIMTTIVLLPFIKLLVLFSEKVIRTKKVSKPAIPQLYYIDERILETPTVAVTQIVKEVANMGDIARKNIQLAYDGFLHGILDKVIEIRTREEEIDFLTREITEYLVRISSLDITFENEKLIGTLYHVVADIERAGDYADNLINYAIKLKERNIEFTEDAMQEVTAMYNLVMEHFDRSMEAFEHQDLSLLPLVADIEDKIDESKAAMADSHIRRLNQGTCSAEAGAIFLSISSNFERVADHMTNVAFSIKDYTKAKHTIVKKMPVTPQGII